MDSIPRSRPSTKLTLVVFLVPILVGIIVFFATFSTASASASQAPSPQLPDNTQCLLCHGQPDQVMELPSGEVLPISIDPQHYGDGIHSIASCQVCHTNISGYPHPENTAQTAREYTLQYQGICEQCHDVQAKELMDSAHTRVFQSGNESAPICADCHNPHADKPYAKTDAGLLAPSEHARIANVCARCHNTIFEQYAESVHGSGVFVEKNPDVPSCTDCHGVHTITGPTGEPSFRLTSPNICAKCHTDEAIMGKYGISTQVLKTYIADFHGTTVTLFEKIDPDQQTNMPVCYDCHGIHDIRRADDPEKGLQVKENLLGACQRCHPDATSNFPDSWLSHYIPTPEKHQLVYYVGLVYKLLIPLVLGAMGLFILTDVYRKIRTRRKSKGNNGSSLEKSDSTDLQSPVSSDSK